MSRQGSACAADSAEKNTSTRTTVRAPERSDAGLREAIRRGLLPLDRVRVVDIGCACDLAFNPGVRQMLVATDRRTARVLDAATFTCVATWECLEGYLVGAEWCPKGEEQVIIMTSNKVLQWDPWSGNTRVVVASTLDPANDSFVDKLTRQIKICFDMVNRTNCEPARAIFMRRKLGMMYSQAEDCMAQCGDSTILYHKSISSTSASTAPSELTGHERLVTGVTWSPGGEVLASGSWDGTVKLWDVQNGAELAELVHGSEVHAIAWSPTGALVAHGPGSDGASVWWF